MSHCYHHQELQGLGLITSLFQMETTRTSASSSVYGLLTCRFML